MQPDTSSPHAQAGVEEAGSPARKELESYHGNVSLLLISLLRHLTESKRASQLQVGTNASNPKKRKREEEVDEDEDIPAHLDSLPRKARRRSSWSEEKKKIEAIKFDGALSNTRLRDAAHCPLRTFAAPIRSQDAKIRRGGRLPNATGQIALKVAQCWEFQGGGCTPRLYKPK